MRDFMAGNVSQALQTAVNGAVSSVFDGAPLPVSALRGTKTAPMAVGRATNLAMCEIQG
jgi:hypothetical protein